MTSPDSLDSSRSRTGSASPRAVGTGADHGLDALLAVRAQIAPDLPEDLLRQCYGIQRQFQFDRDEQLPIVHTRRLVEGFVEREAAERSKELSGGDA